MTSPSFSSYHRGFYLTHDVTPTPCYHRDEILRTVTRLLHLACLPPHLYAGLHIYTDVYFLYGLPTISPPTKLHHTYHFDLRTSCYYAGAVYTCRTMTLLFLPTFPRTLHSLHCILPASFIPPPSFLLPVYLRACIYRHLFSTTIHPLPVPFYPFTAGRYIVPWFADERRTASFYILDAYYLDLAVRYWTLRGTQAAGTTDLTAFYGTRWP